MHFIGIGLGTITGGLLGGYLVDRHVSENWLLIPTLIFLKNRKLSARNKGIAKPEFKLFSLLYCVLIPPLGLLLYGVITWWGIHWIFADAGIVIFCIGVSMAIVSVQSYIVDCYTLLAGSALTSTIVVRSIIGTAATIVSNFLGLDGAKLHLLGRGGFASECRHVME